MHFLITIFKLNFTGTSTYTYTLSKELIKQNHQVTIFSPFHAGMTQPLKDLGVQIIKHPQDLSKISPDIILSQHHFLATIARAQHTDIPMIYISHGVIDGLENPPSIDLNISSFIAVSEEVKDNLHTNHSIPIKNISIIRNSIDTNRFKPIEKIQTFPTNALFIASSRTSKERISLVEDVCKKHNIQLTTLGKANRVQNIEDYIQDSDLVISVGRGVLAAMSSAKAAIVLDHDKGDGIVTEKNISEVMKSNFSGRRYKIEYNKKTLSEEIQKYDQSMGEKNRQLIEDKFNIKSATQQIIKLSQKSIKKFKSKPLNIPTQELNWMYENFIANQITEDWKTKVTRKIKNIIN